MEEKSNIDLWTEILSAEVRAIVYKFLDGLSLTRLLRVNKTTSSEIKSDQNLNKICDDARINSADEKNLHIFEGESRISYSKIKSNTLDSMLNHVSEKKVKDSIKKLKVKESIKKLDDKRSKSFNKKCEESQINIYRHMSWEEREKLREQQKAILKKQNINLEDCFKQNKVR